ncbi:MAG: hypothetical protein ACPGXY_03860 [Alphaproteobacteria bacterium]
MKNMKTFVAVAVTCIAFVSQAFANNPFYSDFFEQSIEAGEYRSLKKSIQFPEGLGHDPVTLELIKTQFLSDDVTSIHIHRKHAPGRKGAGSLCRLLKAYFPRLERVALYGDVLPAKPRNRSTAAFGQPLDGAYNELPSIAFLSEQCSAGTKGHLMKKPLQGQIRFPADFVFNQDTLERISRKFDASAVMFVYIRSSHLREVKDKVAYLREYFPRLTRVLYSSNV